jgi:predicted amidohydrolase YtcJ
MPENTDLLVLAGAILTPTALAGAPAEAGFVAIRDGVIVGVGTPDAADSWIPRAQRVVDLGDATLTAGIVDAHIHPVAGIGMTRGVDLSEAETLEDAQQALAAESADAGEWVFGWGLNPIVFGVAAPSMRLFDRLPQDRLAFVQLFDAHSAVASGAALARAGVTGAETFDDASSIAVDAEGTPTGYLLEHRAMGRVTRIIPALTFEERRDALVAILRGMAETGVTIGQMLDSSDPDAFDLFDAIEAEGELPIRLRVSPMAVPGSTEADWAQLADLQGRHGRRWEVRGIKLMIDGTIDNGTAWLREPDTLGESTESLWLSPPEYAAAVEYFHARGIPTTTHAIGDRGIEFVAATLNGLERTGVPHRMEHIETLPDDVLDLIVEAGVSVSMQPTHCTHFTRADHTDNWSRRLGDERADRAWRTRDLQDKGVVVALGSDWPVAPYDARATLAAAMLRRPAGRVDVTPVLPDQALDAPVALDAHTRGWWRSVGEAGGTIEEGMPAYLTAFSANPLTADPDAFATADVLLTVVGGDVEVDRTAVTARG